ncbi:hypothetical protein [Streptomyces malaysiensis]|uniref:Uncharacterized protein n=1 Tax=Streptomyces malaysiensis TaxID=92644 RepID=A0A7X5X974_STRMQ|nr:MULTISPECIES: hypothetical protein [Streptomyces]AUA11418.1 hypothetical protein CFP59_03531 [Streptomyces sp. M56]MYX57873.1 hypothetical protein [Streptomyces sp. SID8382]NIY68155.1 hypothetical protein [Streptomyces malaysiensis]
MSIDPSDPDTFEDSVENSDETTVYDVEAPEADAVEQHLEVVPRRDERPRADELAEANEADRAEQARVVEENEEDYR